MPCLSAIKSRSFSFKVEGFRSFGSSIIDEGVYVTTAFLLGGLSGEEFPSERVSSSESKNSVDGPTISCSEVDALDDNRVVTISIVLSE